MALLWSSHPDSTFLSPYLIGTSSSTRERYTKLPINRRQHRASDVRHLRILRTFPLCVHVAHRRSGQARVITSRFSRKPAVAHTLLELTQPTLQHICGDIGQTMSPLVEACTQPNQTRADDLRIHSPNGIRRLAKVRIVTHCSLRSSPVARFNCA